MRKAKEDTITMSEYDRYPYWHMCQPLLDAVHRGDIERVELVKTTLNTSGHRLYKVTVSDGWKYTVKVETTFKAAPLEDFINAIIEGKDKKRLVSMERRAVGAVISSDDKTNATFNAYREGYRDGQCDMYVLMNKKEGSTCS